MAQQPVKNTDSIFSFVFKGNTIKARLFNDTLHLRNPATGEWGYKLRQPDTIPVSINGKLIDRVNIYPFGVERDKQPKVKGTTYVLTDWLTQYFHDDIAYVESIGYEIRIRNVAVDDAGHVAYYRARVSKQWNFKDVDSLDIRRAQAINRAVADSLDRVQLNPVIIKGQPTPVYLDYVLGHGWVF